MANIYTQADETTYQTFFYKRLGIFDKVNVIHDTDGYMGGTIFEHKTNVQSYGISKALSQAIIYLTKFNSEGRAIPKNIALISQNEAKAYFFESSDFLKYIENIPEYASLPASKGIKNFKTNINPEVINFDLYTAIKNQTLLNRLLRDENKYTKVHIDEHNVYGWSNTYYLYKPKSSRLKYLEELRSPNVLYKYIYPWKGQEEDFSLIMDLLGSPKQKKDLGAFYTPILYAKKSLELLRKAINNVPKGNDYIILDRCGGTGSLEIVMNEKELSHVIINTYEVKEWHALKDLLGKQVKDIIPPMPTKHKYPSYDNNGLFSKSSNALSKEFLERPDIKKYIDDPKCNIIMLENPPYRDITAKDKGKDTKEKSYIYNQFVNENSTDQSMHRDISNLFIWSAFRYYLKDKHDAYILYSPIKYWKTEHLVNKKMNEGFLFNRKYFHASPSAISCIYWENIDQNMEQIQLTPYDIKDNNLLKQDPITINKTYTSINKIKNHNNYSGDKEANLYCELSGYPSNKPVKNSRKPIINNNIIGYVRYTSTNFDSNSWSLTRTITRDALEQSYGAYLREDNFELFLPLFAAKLYPQKNWEDKGTKATTADDGIKYQSDDEFIKKCLIYTGLCQQNHILNFYDNGKLFTNEICLDHNTILDKKLDNYALDTNDFNIIKQYRENILNIVKTCKEYKSNYKYGLDQIDKEINIKIPDTDENGNKILDKNGNIKYVHKYGDLNNNIRQFKKDLVNYYINNISQSMKKYKLVF